jgi:phosphate transport system protein
MARPIFDEELHQLRSDVIEMAEFAKEAIEGSFDAVRQVSATKAYLVASNDSLIDGKEREIESLCLRLLLCEQPVASDLRSVTAALKMITDIERIGDQAAEICEIATALSKDADLPLFPMLGAMAQADYDQLDSAIQAYVDLDLDKAQSCIEGDKEVNALFEEAKRSITRHIIEHEPDETYALDVLMIAKYLERIGDHAVNIAEWAEYAITGNHKGVNIAEGEQ